MRSIIVEAEVSLDGVIGSESPDFWGQVFKYHGEPSDYYRFSDSLLPYCV